MGWLPGRQVRGLEGVHQGPAQAGTDVRATVPDVDDRAVAMRDTVAGAGERGLVGPGSPAGEDAEVGATAFDFVGQGGETQGVQVCSQGVSVRA